MANEGGMTFNAPVTGQNFINQLQGDLIVDGGGRYSAIDVLRHHVANSPQHVREDFAELEKELTSSQPNKSTIEGKLKALGGVLGGVAACATAITKIAAVAGLSL